MRTSTFLREFLDEKKFNRSLELFDGRSSDCREAKKRTNEKQKVRRAKRAGGFRCPKKQKRFRGDGKCEIRSERE